MGFRISDHGKMGFTVQDDHAENSSQSQNAQGGKPGQAADKSSEASSNQAAQTRASPPPAHHADNPSRSHEAGAAQHQDSVADKKAKGIATGDEVVVNQQAQNNIQNQLLNQPPPLPNDQDPGVQSVKLSASDAQRLFQSMGDIDAQLNLCEQDSSSDNHSQIEDALKKIQDDITKREAFNSRFTAQFDKIMGEIGADAARSQFCRNNNLQNDQLTQNLEQQLGLSPDQAVALVQGIRDGGAAGTALALSLATLLVDKELEDGGLATTAGGSAGGATTGDADATNAGNDNGIALTAAQKKAEDAAISADALQLVADAQNYDKSGSLFGAPDPGSAAAMQLLQDAMNVLVTGMSGSAASQDASGGNTDANAGDPPTATGDPTNDSSALAPGSFNAGAGTLFVSMVNNSQFDSPTAALNAILQSNTDDISALQKAAAALLVQAAAGQRVTRAIELAATNAGDNVNSVFNPSLLTAIPVNTRA